MRNYFHDTKAYSFYCKRIQQEWIDRVEVNKGLLMNSDIALIESYIYKIIND